MRNGEIELEKYVIRKTLTKSPEEYPDGRNQAHVQVCVNSYLVFYYAKNPIILIYFRFSIFLLMYLVCSFFLR